MAIPAKKQILNSVLTCPEKIMIISSTDQIHVDTYNSLFIYVLCTLGCGLVFGLF
jgi:hypothetical protein